MFQLALTDDMGLTPPTTLAADFFGSPIFSILLTVVFIFAFVTIVLVIVRRRYHLRGSASGAFDMSVMLVRVPKELHKGDADEGRSTQQIQEMIGAMETIFATFGSLAPQHGAGSWLLGRQDHFSF